MPDGIELVRRLAAECVASGEAPPFSDQALVDLDAGRATLVAVPSGDGVAIIRDAEFEAVVRQEARGTGTGSALVARVLAREPAPTLAWAHGDHPAARALAHRHGWTAVRTLLQLRAPIAPRDDARTPDPHLPAGYRLSSFVVGTDESDWLELNAAAFAHHPEQGSMTLADLRSREGEAWFDPDDLLLLRDGAGTLVASCWLKVEQGIGEFYAVAVRPGLQGQGLGGVLMRAGFARLADRALDSAALYVEGDNTPALALYRRSGFTEHAVDVQYAAPGTGTPA